jgi:LmbE family N-acetylglucosaminyl deacetylase
MLTSHERITRQKESPALLRLHRALGRLTSTLTYMNTGAHPDDEHNGLLAALRYAYGMQVVVACGTRGEGGQNAIGPERGAALGVLRTREMEEAARTLDARVVWLGHGPDDPVHDFGFSKNGDDTLWRWGEERIVERLVRAYRTQRPDIVCPTFLDVPGQHGHHRAMTRAAIAAFGLAADPAAFPQHLAEGLTPWQVAKFYLPAWSGAGTSYDDEEPPPSETVVVAPPRRDIVTGATYAQIGEWSRAFHRCQGMGVWRDVGRTHWPLHLLIKAGQAAGPETDIRDGLPRDLAGLASLPGMSPAAVGALEDAHIAIGEAVARFPDRRAIAAAALRAARAVTAAQEACPDVRQPDLAHRLARKARELDAVLIETQGVVSRATAQPRRVAPGGAVSIEVFVEADDRSVTVTPVLAPTLAETGRRTEGETTVFDLAADPAARPTSPYPPGFDPLGSNGEAAIRLTMEIEGRPVSQLLDLEEPLVILPETSIRLEPDAIVLNLARPSRSARVAVATEPGGKSGETGFDCPIGWQVAHEGDGIRIDAPADLGPGRTSLRPTHDGIAAARVTPVAYPHIGRAFHHCAADLPVLAVEAALPEDVRLAYVGGGNDRIGTWLSRLGLDVVELDRDRLQDPLDGFTTIVVGIFAFGTRPDLAAASPRLRTFVEAGGHLVTFYHRPSDGWDPDATVPRRMAIGLPSLRWRVTNPHAPVQVLVPDHPLLIRPNTIDEDDWAGWDKERGLYFASQWDPAYEPLLAMNDPGESALTGSLLSGIIGQGRHTHVSLALHHQLDRLVPGAFRLLANLVQKA